MDNRHKKTGDNTAFKFKLGIGTFPLIYTIKAQTL